MEKVAIPVLLVLALVLTGVTNFVPKTTGYRQVTTEEAVNIMQTEENYVILDVRTAQEFASGHIPGAVLLPNETIGTEDIPLLPDKDQLILVYCRSGQPGPSRQRKSWRSWAIPTLWNSAVSTAGPARLSRNECETGPREDVPVEPRNTGRLFYAARRRSARSSTISTTPRDSRTMPSA